LTKKGCRFVQSSISSPAILHLSRHKGRGSRASTTLNGVTDTYAVDDGDKLTSIAQGSTTVKSYTYSYDGAGNLVHNRLSTWTFNDDDQINANSSVYDGDGNPTTYYYSQSYDRENRVTSINTGFWAGYGPDGSRVWKSAGSSAPKTYFLYDGADPVAELDSTGAVTAIDVFAPDGLVGRKQVGAWTFYQYDLQGNAVQRTNAGGAITAGAAYDAYGYMSLSGPDDQPFAYNARWGYYRDVDLGTYFCQNRYYDPLGRWMTRDPIGFAGGMNLYAYCGGNPVGRIDPGGLAPGDGDGENEDPEKLAYQGAGAGYSSSTIGDPAYRGNPPGFEGASNMGEHYFPALSDEPTPEPAPTSADETSTSECSWGSYSIWKGGWEGYPEGLSKPTGPFHNLEGEEYKAARGAADSENRRLRSMFDPPPGSEIHEIHPVKQGGSPIDPVNKEFVDGQYHRRVISPWWRRVGR
jgi:RHS repeat-associated protein